MANTGFQGVFTLNVATIDRIVTNTSPGAYALTRKVPKDPFIVNYVGRSNSDLNGRLKSWESDGKYTHFKSGYFSSSNAAFETECHFYHDFGESRRLDNTFHPARPKNASWNCPACSIYD